MIPDDLISYIADTYVNSRQIDFKAAKKNDELFAVDIAIFQLFL